MRRIDKRRIRRNGGKEEEEEEEEQKDGAQSCGGREKKKQKHRAAQVSCWTAVSRTGAPVSWKPPTDTVLDGNFHERMGGARRAVLLAVFCFRFWLFVQVLCSTAPRR